MGGTLAAGVVVTTGELPEGTGTPGTEEPEGADGTERTEALVGKREIEEE